MPEDSYLGISQDLVRTLEQLDAVIADLPSTGPHLVPDLVLRSYLHDVAANARVVRLLVATELRRHAFPSARACFEASQYALLLATDPSYDLAGAKAWVHSHLKDRREGSDAESIGLLNDQPNHMPAAEFFAKRFIEMKGMWDTYGPNKGHFLDEAEVILEKQPKKPDNWMGVSIGKALGERFEAMPRPTSAPGAAVPPRGILGSTYGHLSAETHPHASRLDPVKIVGDPGGPLTFDFGPDDSAEQADLAETITMASLNLALTAVGLRLRMNDEDR